MVEVAPPTLKWQGMGSEVAELQEQMDNLEKRIGSCKQEVVMVGKREQDMVELGRRELNVVEMSQRTEKLEVGESKSKWKNYVPVKPETRWGKPVYQEDPLLPKGWKFFDNGKGSMFFKNAAGKFIKNRRNCLTEMYQDGGYTPAEITYIRDGLVDEGWKYHADLPCSWLFKQYSHKIEGVDTDVIYLLTPSGEIIRSKKKIRRDHSELQLSPGDLKKLLDFRPDDFEDCRVLENPDDNWPAG